MNGLDLTEWLEGDELVSSAWVKDVLEKADRAPDFRNPILAFTVSLKADFVERIIANVNG